MNLENLNLVELNAQEVQEVDGGMWLEFIWHIGFHYGGPSHDGLMRDYKGNVVTA